MTTTAWKKRDISQKPQHSTSADQKKGKKKANSRRGITYTIQKNKGLSPWRDARNNPRVKNRVMLAKKRTKFRSMKPVYNGGEGRGGYKGELSGIKTHLVKSVKL